MYVRPKKNYLRAWRYDPKDLDTIPAWALPNLMADHNDLPNITFHWEDGGDVKMVEGEDRKSVV